MQYPLYVNRTRSTALHAHFPDFPDVDLIGHSIAEIERNAPQVVEQAYDGSEQLIAAPTRDTELRALETVGEDGLWLYVDIDLARVTSTAVELQFSVPDSLLRRVDATARARQMTRAEFFSLAVARELQRERTPQIPPAALIAGKRSTLHIGSKS
jgi:predicted RNase H-like HicB family nuclease